MEKFHFLNQLIIFRFNLITYKGLFAIFARIHFKINFKFLKFRLLFEIICFPFYQNLEYNLLFEDLLIFYQLFCQVNLVELLFLPLLVK